jgi:hypothetical protein
MWMMLADISEERTFLSFRVEEGNEDNGFFRNVLELLLCNTVLQTGRQQTL